MKKWAKILAIIIACLMVISFAACSSEMGTETSSQTSSQTSSTEKVKKEVVPGLVFIEAKSIKDSSGFTVLYQYILYDPDNMVMYSFIENDDEAGFSMMYNADGTPKLYNPDKYSNTNE